MIQTIVIILVFAILITGVIIQFSMKSHKGNDLSIVFGAIGGALAPFVTDYSLVQILGIGLVVLSLFGLFVNLQNQRNKAEQKQIIADKAIDQTRDAVKLVKELTADKAELQDQYDKLKTQYDKNGVTIP